GCGVVDITTGGARGRGAVGGPERPAQHQSRRPGSLEGDGGAEVEQGRGSARLGDGSARDRQARAGAAAMAGRDVAHTARPRQSSERAPRRRSLHARRRAATGQETGAGQAGAGRCLTGRVKQKGYTLIPLRIYFTRNHAKVEVGLARGKRQFDKREAIAERDAKREIARAVRRG